VEQEETLPPKDEWPWAWQKGKFSILYISLLHFISCISFRFPIKLLYIAW
jgi:hypothetical protein